MNSNHSIAIDSVSSDCYEAAQKYRIILAWLMLGVSIFGILANGVSFIVFTQPISGRSAINILFAGLNVVDTVLLILAMPVFEFFALPIWNSETQAIWFQAYTLKYIYPITMMAQTCSVYVIIAVTIERFIAICRPLKANLWCTRRHSKLALLLCSIFSISYNFCRFWEYSIVHINGSAMPDRYFRDFAIYPLYMYVYYIGAYLLVNFAIPFVSIFLLNGSAICAIIKVSKKRRRLSIQEVRERTPTKLMLLITTLFGLCNSLPLVLNILDITNPELFTDPRYFTISYTLNEVSNLLVLVNSATPPIIYYIFAKKYRKTLHLLLHYCFTGSKGPGLASRRQSSLNSYSYHELSVVGRKCSTSVNVKTPLVKKQLTRNKTEGLINLKNLETSRKRCNSFSTFAV